MPNYALAHERHVSAAARRQAELLREALRRSYQFQLRPVRRDDANEQG
jgi:hypothetical protein